MVLMIVQKEVTGIYIVINSTFTLPDFPGAKASSENILIAIFKSSESYGNLKIALHNIANEGKDLSYVKVQEKIHPLAFYVIGIYITILAWY